MIPLNIILQCDECKNIITISRAQYIILKRIQNNIILLNQIYFPLIINGDNIFNILNISCRKCKKSNFTIINK
jgi:hypothetical protein